MKNKFYNNGVFCEKRFIEAIKEGPLSNGDIVDLQSCFIEDNVGEEKCKSSLESFIRSIILKLQVYMLPGTKRFLRQALIRDLPLTIGAICCDKDEKEACDLLKRCLSLPLTLRNKINDKSERGSIKDLIIDNNLYPFNQDIRSFYPIFQSW